MKKLLLVISMLIFAMLMTACGAAVKVFSLSPALSGKLWASCRIKMV